MKKKVYEQMVLYLETINYHFGNLMLRLLTLLSCLFTFQSAQAAGTINVDELNDALKKGLEKGRDAGKEVSCTAIGVFFEQSFVKFIIGGMVLVTVTMIAFGWYSQNKSNPPSRLFWLIVFSMAFVAVASLILTSFMGC